MTIYGRDVLTLYKKILWDDSETCRCDVGIVKHCFVRHQCHDEVLQSFCNAPVVFPLELTPNIRRAVWMGQDWTPICRPGRGPFYHNKSSWLWQCIWLMTRRLLKHTEKRSYEEEKLTLWQSNDFLFLDWLKNQIFYPVSKQIKWKMNVSRFAWAESHGENQLALLGYNHWNQTLLLLIAMVANAAAYGLLAPLKHRHWGEEQLNRVWEGKHMIHAETRPSLYVNQERTVPFQHCPDSTWHHPIVPKDMTSWNNRNMALNRFTVRSQTKNKRYTCNCVQFWRKIVPQGWSCTT